MTIHWLTVVWGKEFTDYYVNVVIPNQLSPLNLPKCCADGRSKYIIYTTPEDAQTIYQSPAYGKLLSVMHGQVEMIEHMLNDVSPQAQRETETSCKTVVETPPSVKHFDKYGAMTRCHRHAIFAARNETDVAFVFLAPDAVVSDGSFSNMLRIANTGKRAIMVHGLRVNKDSFAPAFVQEHYCDTSKTAEISSRELARLAIDHLHPLMNLFFWNSEKFSEWPSFLLWKASPNEILARCFHLHPLFLRPVDPHAVPENTIDGDYLIRACPNWDDIHIVEDSDEVLCIEATKATNTHLEALSPPTRNLVDARKFGLFAFRHCDDHHRAFFKRTICIHAENISPEWRRLAEQTRQIETSVLNWYRLYYWTSLIPVHFLFTRRWWKELSWSFNKRIRLRTRLKSLVRKWA